MKAYTKNLWNWFPVIRRWPTGELTFQWLFFVAILTPGKDGNYGALKDRT